MKTYKLTFKSLSSITKIPDAQTIFGSICAIIKYTKGEKELNNYFDSFQEHPIFVHSSMYIDGVLPMAKVGLVSIEEKNHNVFELPPSEQLKYLSELKKYKKISGVTLDIYNQYLIDGKFQNLKEDLFSKKLLITNGIITKDSKEYESQLQLVVHTNQETNIDNDKIYYDNNLYYSQDCLFCVYVKTDNIEYVKDIFKYSQYFGFGNRVSVGKNCFEMIEVVELEKKTSNNEYKILLSKCISDEFDLEKSFYILDSKVYQGSKYYSSNKIGRFNRFVEGSYMKIKESKEYYGQLVKCDNGKVIYHYGIGFVLWGSLWKQK